MTVIGALVVNVVGHELETRTYDRLAVAQGAARVLLEDRRVDLEQRVAQRAISDVPALLALSPGALTEAITQLRIADQLDQLMVIDPAGTIVASSRESPRFASGVVAPTDVELAQGGTPSLAMAARASMRQRDGTPAGTLVGVVWRDNDLLDRMFRSVDIDLTIVDDGRVVASTGAVRIVDRRFDPGRYEARVGSAASYVVAENLPASRGLLFASSPRAPVDAARRQVILLLVGLLAFVTLLVVAWGYIGGGFVAKPLRELAEAALAVSRGDLDRRVAVHGDREVADLARAFNSMTDNLRAQMSELQQSRSEFREAMSHLGDALQRTHEWDGIVDVVLEASALTLRADTAVFYELTGIPPRLKVSACHGIDMDDVELDGEGIATDAVRHGKPVLHPGPAPLAHGEPRATAAVAVPMVLDGRVIGALAVYASASGAAFGADDAELLQTLARQAEAALANVKLHETVSVQAITDGLTGLWNRRHFDIKVRDQVKEADRYNEPFGVLVVDIDHFKVVNDTHGHATGDAALVWLSGRLIDATREIDTVARWGGEEFTLLLPRTGHEETAIVAERVRASVARRPFAYEGKVIPLTVSVGYACHPEDGKSAMELLAAADAAMYRAKAAGRDRVERAGSAKAGGIAG